MYFKLIFIVSNSVGEPAMTEKEAEEIIASIRKQENIQNADIWTAIWSEAKMLASCCETVGTRAFYEELGFDQSETNTEWLMKKLADYEKSLLIIIGNPGLAKHLTTYYSKQDQKHYPGEVIIFHQGEIKKIERTQEVSLL